MKAALAMQTAIAKLGEAWVERGLQPLQVRIGVATGEVFVGQNRPPATPGVHGDRAAGEPRVAPRGKAPPGGLLVSGGDVGARQGSTSSRGAVHGLDLKGYAGGYDAWLVTGLIGADGTSAASASPIDARQSARLPFFADVTITIDGSDVLARSSDISPGGMFVNCDVVPKEGSTVKVKAMLARQSKALAVSMEARVTHARDGGFGLMFTTVYADDQSAILALLQGVLGDDSFDEALIEGAVGAAGGFSSKTAIASCESAPTLKLRNAHHRFFSNPAHAVHAPTRALRCCCRAAQPPYLSTDVDCAAAAAESASWCAREPKRDD